MSFVFVLYGASRKGSIGSNENHCICSLSLLQIAGQLLMKYTLYPCYVLQTSILLHLCCICAVGVLYLCAGSITAFVRCPRNTGKLMKHPETSAALRKESSETVDLFVLKLSYLHLFV